MGILLIPDFFFFLFDGLFPIAISSVLDYLEAKN
jgi:hypothetical protein